MAMTSITHVECCENFGLMTAEMTFGELQYKISNFFLSQRILCHSRNTTGIEIWRINDANCLECLTGNIFYTSKFQIVSIDDDDRSRDIDDGY